LSSGASSPPVGQLHAFFDRVLDSQRQRNCVGGCAMGNLASELSDVHEGFRQQLAGIFDVYRDHLAEAIRRGQRSGGLRPDADAARVAQFLVGGLEGASLLGKVTRDITVIERCVEELKAHLTLYRNRA
jgi:TetR/AcrR family transcriptional repressor of nem operon